MKAMKRKKKSIFLRIALLAFSIYVVVMLVWLQNEISSKEKKIADMDAAIQRLTVQNEDLQNQSDNYEKFLEQEARRQGYAIPGETIYKEE